MMVLGKLQCPSCGKIVSDEDLNWQVENGGLPYCYCKYMAIDEKGEIWFPGEYTKYLRIR